MGDGLIGFGWWFSRIIWDNWPWVVLGWWFQELYGNEGFVVWGRWISRIISGIMRDDKLFELFWGHGFLELFRGLWVVFGWWNSSNFLGDNWLFVLFRDWLLELFGDDDDYMHYVYIYLYWCIWISLRLCCTLIVMPFSSLLTTLIVMCCPFHHYWLPLSSLWAALSSFW